MKTRILITGADGFIGSHLTEKLVDYGALVSIFTNKRELKNLNHIKNKLKDIIIEDISNKKTIELIFKNNPQIIFHLAADSNVRNSIENPIKINEINLSGTLNVLEAARLLKNNELIRVIFSSSSIVYGTKLNPIKETDEIKPNNPYGASKASADIYCYSYFKTYNLPIIVIRAFNIYGPRQSKDTISLFIKSSLRNENLKLEGGGLQTRDFNYIDDIINAFLIVGLDKKAIGETINFGSGKDISIKNLAKKIIEYSKSNSKIIDVPERLGQDLKSCCDNSKAKTLFNWDPKIPIDEGMKRTIEWFKS